MMRFLVMKRVIIWEEKLGIFKNFNFIYDSSHGTSRCDTNRDCHGFESYRSLHSECIGLNISFSAFGTDL